MSAQRDGGPAFPLPGWDTVPWSKDVPACFGTGMTLRGWFAGQALAGVVANPTMFQSIEGAAKNAIAIADAMLAAREVRS